MALLLLAVVALAAAQTPFQGLSNFIVVRDSFTESQARNSGSDQICTAIYNVTLLPAFTTQGNDVGMLQPHGRNTSNFGNVYSANWAGQNLATIGADYSKFPFPNDAAKQAYAKSIFSVTALTEPTGTPLGFKPDTLRMHYSVCVRLFGVQSRWVEVMAQSPQPDRKLCVSDWRPDNGGRPNLNDNPFLTSCGQGHLYSCRPSPNAIVGGVVQDSLSLRFYCENCDDEQVSIYWRVTASQQPPSPSGVQKDSEDWCLWRQGADYPSSLLQPYPQDYVPPPVFEASLSSAWSLAVSVWLLAGLALLALVL